MLNYLLGAYDRGGANRQGEFGTVEVPTIPRITLELRTKVPLSVFAEATTSVASPLPVGALDSG